MIPRLAPALVALLLLPSALGGWSANGGFEPDTPDDVNGGRMWLDPDTSPTGWRVYFDVVVTDAHTNTNPNVGLLRSRVLPPGALSMQAWLGLWKDCNDDGYVGAVETALSEYRTELLVDNKVCPPGSPWNHHNWVSEFIHIGDDSPSNVNAFPRVLRDNDARVWGDFGQPGVSDRYFCARDAPPRGTFDSTGGLLRHLDCNTGYHFARHANALDEDGQYGLRFDDPYHPERDCDHPLNVPLDTYGADPCHPDDPGTLEGNSGSPTFTVWDCAGYPATLAPAVHDLDGSLADSYNQRLRCTSGAYPEYGPLEDRLGVAYEGTNPTDGKRRPDFHFEFAISAGVSNFHQGLPELAGITALANAPWQAEEYYAPPANLGGTVRTETLALAGGTWFTFYAKLGRATIDRGVGLPEPISGEYGLEACQGAETGVVRGWDCDGTHWWNPAYGGVAHARGERVGMSYQLRDNDCFDGQASDGLGIFASLAFISDEPPCPAPLGQP